MELKDTKINDKMIEISIDEYNELKEKAEKWDNFRKKQSAHLNSISKEEHSARSRRAAMARWAKSKNK